MQKGSVKWWNNEKGYGFIVPDDGGKDVFVHFTELGDDFGSAGRRYMVDGDQVQFDTKMGQRGIQATNVSKAH